MKDMGEASYVIRIEIFQDKSQGLLGLSQKIYIERILEKFNMKYYSIGIVSIQKRDKFNLIQCLKDDMKWKQMELIPYSSIMGSLMYLQTYIKLYISFAVGMLGRYQNNSGIDYWKVTKKVL